MSWRRTAWAFLAALLISGNASAQAFGSPEQALVELVLAADLKTAKDHLPVAISRELADLPPPDLNDVERRLIPANFFRSSGVKPRSAENGRDLLVFEPIDPARQPTTVRIVRRIADGVDAMLQMESCSNGGCYGRMQLWLKLEEGEWRLQEIDGGRYGPNFRFDDPKVLASFHNSEQNRNEQQAIGSLRVLVTALVNYSSVFPDVGLPQELNSLTASEKKSENEDESEASPDWQHAGLIDASFAMKPCIRNGYKFDYAVLVQGPEGSYSITARPVQFGKTGFQSFFVDESGVIRATREDRVATVQDDPIQ